MPEGTIERPLSPSLPRDCGHECRVCKVTVVSLTDYASHISSPTHKQNVEAAEKSHAGNDREEDYFDQVLVDLIEKRKVQIRKEKEAAAAKLAREEEDRKRKEELKQRLRASERYQQDCGWQQWPSPGFSGSSKRGSWYSSNQYNPRAGEPRPWCNGNQGKSATWHAQEPPNFQKWGSGEFGGGSLNRQWDQGGLCGNQQSRLPWLSNGGSCNGIYGRNNISLNPQRGRPLSLFASPSSFLSHASNQFQNPGNEQRGQQGKGLQNGPGQTAEPEHNSTKSSKSFGSNPKLDKACRWSPYPVTKGFESVPSKDGNAKSSEKNPNVPKAQMQDLSKQSQPEQKPKQSTSSQQSVEEKGKHKMTSKAKARDQSSSSDRSSSAQRNDHQNPASGPSTQRASKPLPHKDKKMSSSSAGGQISKASNQAQLKATAKQTGFNPQAPSVGSQLPEMTKKAKETVLEKRGSLDRNNMMEMTLHIVEEQRSGVNKENSCKPNAAKTIAPDPVRPGNPAAQTSDGSQFLQLLQVSTSTADWSEPAASSVDDKENRKKEEAAQAAEAGQSSESDTSRSGEAVTVSGSNASSLSKLDLPPALKRDLTKHISSKSKTGSLEPNLNIARRVRNLSESRRSDSEKDSGLKPTVRQLISSSGSRRNVNWEQVYQEVRKKQDKGKGMPRFGIEMVPLDQEDQSQEEDDIPLLEGFQWDSLMDTSSSGATRKRSLSESSVAPASSQSLFAPLTSKEAAQWEVLGSGQQGPSVGPGPAQGDKDNQCQQAVEQMLGLFEGKAQKQPDKLTSATVKVLQRSDSVLGDSSSGTEQCDGQGTGKRRRGVRDAPSAETSCLEHNNKRRKVKSKKERLQIDQLLAVSLREDELSRSLQTVDTSLIQARAALEAAYMEVQRLMVVKQQMTGEMNTLRNKRIELLKGMQDNRADEPLVKLKEEKINLLEAEPHVPASISLPAVRDATPAAAASSPGPRADCASPRSPSLPFMPVVIKQEPQSPVHVSSEPDAVENTTHFAHSTTPELPVAPAAAASPRNSCDDLALSIQVSPERKSEQCQTERVWENFDEPADCKDSLSGLVEMTERAVQATRSCSTPPFNSKASIKLLPDVGNVGNCAATEFCEPPSVPSVLNLPTSPSELRGGKRVRKLKKRKVLKKAQGTEQPESSDTEIDGEALRPRWLRPRRRPSGSSQVSTSTQPSEDRDGDVNMEAGEEEPVRQLFPVPKQEKENPKSLDLIVNSYSEESMEVTAAFQAPAPPPAQVPPDSSTLERPLSLACNEVSSTSDMDLCTLSESDGQISLASQEMMKVSSDAVSDHGEDDLPTEGAFEGHQEAVNAMQIHGGLLYTCSGDRTVKAFDLVSHKCVGVFEGHSSKVSCLLVSAAPSLHHRLYSGSSDQTIRCYNLKTRELEQQFSLSDRVLCLHSRWKCLYAGLANGTVVTFNLKTNKQMDVFECHGPRAVGCLASSQEGARRILLVGSYDNTISVRDAKNGLLLRTLEGHTKTVLCMKVVNDLVFSGSSDQCVYAHNIHTGELVRVYKGHSHAVTVVAVMGKVMVTACLDKLVRVYDLQSHEQLQVYGGHKDMVMCMTVHKNMIYTGCYDGSVQAVKLNLMQNNRCWWHGCSLVFGMMEHLQQHLINDHTSTNFQILKCHWKKCEVFFCGRNSSKQGMLLHMRKHAEESESEP